MIKEDLYHQINKVETVANLSKLGRLMKNPFKYIYAIAFRKLIYPAKKQESVVSTDLFYKRKMKIALPAATDIYLTGGKSHDSEIRLAKFLILNLNDSDHFLDVGAHFGYFTLLGSEIVGVKGKVFSYEPASKSFNILKANVSFIENISIFNKAVSSSNNKVRFFEFPTPYSEFNSSEITQFEKEEWFKGSQPVKTEVEATTIDQIINEFDFKPHIIKIDVEGSEYEVIKGGEEFFKTGFPSIVIEYLEQSRHNKTHRKAAEFLRSIGYTSNLIKKDGTLERVDKIEDHLSTNGLESDNIVFTKL